MSSNGGTSKFLLKASAWTASAAAFWITCGTDLLSPLREARPNPSRYMGGSELKRRPFDAESNIKVKSGSQHTQHPLVFLVKNGPRG